MLSCLSCFRVCHAFVFVMLSCLSCFRVCHAFVFVMLLSLFNAALWSSAGNGLTSSLSCMIFIFCYFLVWCPGSGVELDCIDS